MNLHALKSHRTFQLGFHLVSRHITPAPCDGELPAEGRSRGASSPGEARALLQHPFSLPAQVCPAPGLPCAEQGCRGDPFLAKSQVCSPSVMMSLGDLVWDCSATFVQCDLGG